MGPVVSLGAAERLLAAQTRMLDQGAIGLRIMKQAGIHSSLLTPGLIDVTGVVHRNDEELFGPLLQVVRVKNLETAIDEANRTAFGLAAGLLSDDEAKFRTFKRRVRAGVLNWNRPTTGASAKLPFGGLRASGNHRPSGFLAVDYCADAIASQQSEFVSLPKSFAPGIRRS